MIREEDDGVWLEIEESIAIHHEEVFGCLMTGSGLTRWLCMSAEVDPRPGGLVRLGWDERMKRTTTVAILELDAGGRVTWDWYADHGNLHAPVYWHVEPVVEEGSRVHLRQGPFRMEPSVLLLLAEQAQYWQWHVCNLRAVLEAKLDMRRHRPL